MPKYGPMSTSKYLMSNSYSRFYPQLPRAPKKLKRPTKRGSQIPAHSQFTRSQSSKKSSRAGLSATGRQGTTYKILTK